MVNILDGFSGIGGFSLAIKRAGFEINKHYFAEIDKYAQQIYKKQYPRAIQLGDITKVGNEHGKIDIATFGFPCQAFSIAGKRRGFEDTRGTLFFEIERLCRFYRPSYMVLENVKGLASHEGGNTIRVILDKLRGLNYSVQLVLINTKDFGIPQNRERFAFICTARGKRQPEISGIRERKTEVNEGVIAISTRHSGLRGPEYSNGMMPCLTATGYKDQHKVKVGTLRTHKDGEGFREVKSGLCPTIPARAREDGSGQPIISYQRCFSNQYSERIEETGSLQASRTDKVPMVRAICTPEIAVKNQNGRIVKDNEEPMFTLSVRDRHGVMLHKVRTETGKQLRKEYEAGNIKHGFNEHRTLEPKEENISGTISTFPDDNVLLEDSIIRRLTPIECERLQGYPDVGKTVTIQICLDHQKINVNAEEKNHRLLKHAGNVERIDIKEIVLSVEKNLNIKNLQTNKLAQENVHINLGEESVEIFQNNEQLLNVNSAEKKEAFDYHMEIEDFALLNVGIITTMEKIIDYGKVGSQQKDHRSIHQENGKKHVKLCGKEIMQHVDCAMTDLTILKKPLKSIISEHLSIKSQEQKLKTLFSYVILAISGYIPKITQNQNTLTIKINQKHGWTKYGIDENGKEVEISDTQRYKTCGDSITVKPFEEIMKAIYEVYY